MRLLVLLASLSPGVPGIPAFVCYLSGMSSCGAQDMKWCQQMRYRIARDCHDIVLQLLLNEHPGT